jgi:hypothetical protein
VNDLISTRWLVNRMLENQRRQYEMMVRIGWCKSLEQLQAEWRARPWYERTRITTLNWIRAKRIRLGEIIAGMDFE